MKGVLPAVLAVMLLAPASASARPCERPAHRIIAKTRRALVLTRHGRYWGCLVARDRLVRLDRPDAREALYGFDLAGRYVGFVASGSDGASEYDSVVAQDLRSGQTVRSAGVTKSRSDSDDTGTATDLRVTRHGYLAWIGCFDGGCHGAVARQVFRFDSRGRRLLDRGPLIRRHSLRIRDRGCRVTWIDHGRRRVATLR
jgi:hypothetical protein